ncbi:hypothetical protein LTR78_004488 [Recurvomyces mirabilis]|uniref:Uncharacterized protein n=1 Tax=Recurvomyces mirabilis TaxID=574656 RepID=A0AAE0WQB1_9PEZI|nr:hypothetical protein LTR78_004488 [Recurvomyces mirabilis]KAK5155846.1 hypothetical protein LTS14_005412 [Recurvomyces mirabilis]
MDPQACPLPQVAQALEPYIKSRHEVTRIRNELHGHLHKHAQQDGTPLTAMNLTSPRDALPQKEIPTTISGVRRAYLKALQAYTAAQGRYDSLKADLDALNDTSKSSTQLGHSPSAVNETLIPLLRQREKRRRLEVIEQTYSAVIASGGDVMTTHLDDIIKNHAGEVPTPPIQNPPSFGEKPDVASRILQLKKDVLSTKHAINRVSASQPDHVSNRSTTGNNSDVAGLQEALNVLTSWMETQLATIGDAEADAQHYQSIPNDHEQSSTVSIEDISTRYDDYITARTKLLHTISKPSTPAHEPTSWSTPSNAGDATKQDNNKSAAEILLPLLPALTGLKTQEQSLLHQSSHLRKLLLASEAQTQQLIMRLSEESHLVRPGAVRGKDWAEAAAQADSDTASYVQGRVGEGERRAIEAEEMLERVRGMPELVGQVVEVMGRKTLN